MVMNYGVGLDLAIWTEVVLQLAFQSFLTLTGCASIDQAQAIPNPALIKNGRAHANTSSSMKLTFTLLVFTFSKVKNR